MYQSHLRGRMDKKYGEEITVEFKLLEVEDFEDLQPFTCGNQKLDNHIHGLIQNNQICDDDGLYFVFKDSETKEIVAISSLAASGIIFEQTNYTHVLPAIKIDILAVDVKYQKMHYDLESEVASDPNDHYYFSDYIMGQILCHCRNVAETGILANYILLYADKKAYRYYERNAFLDFEEYMVKENNQEINENIPMYMKLD